MKPAFRVIARLDIKDENLVKGINFEGLRVLGKPNEFAQHYYENGIDEIFYQDVIASLLGRNNLKEIIAHSSKNIFVPIIVGGGIRKLDDMNLPKIDYIKVDTEGFEIEVLKGGEKMIEEYKPFIHVEVKGKVLVKQGLSSDDVDEYLKSLNYNEVFRISSERVYAHNKK